ncbi:hypothetical protein GPECTOR_22g842 [Gonium pectorale]|uniref:histidine kinase n=1 Tax=Gonium pectorale TaxID=33097 RepID=A0A150GIN0_GONPE|nr:hypothetical protein GPECTOR_22g842 [Gonium pectorale]|eukprot:KXZ49250.1 hypothetical protein GPECTOR_22g842 [Gonium pectorale]
MVCVKRPGGSAQPTQPQPQPHLTAAEHELLRCATALLRNSPQPMCVIRPEPADPAFDLAPAGPTGSSIAGAPYGSSDGGRSAGAIALHLGLLGACGGGALEGTPPWTAYALLATGDTSSDAEHEAPSRSSSGGPPPGSAAASLPPSSPFSTASAATTRGSAPSLGTLLCHNEAFSRMCGHMGPQLQSSGLGVFFRPLNLPSLAASADAQKGLNALASALSSGVDSCSVELPCYHASGRKMWCRVHVSRLQAEAEAEAEPEAEPEAGGAVLVGWVWDSSSGIGPSGQARSLPGEALAISHPPTPVAAAPSPAAPPAFAEWPSSVPPAIAGGVCCLRDFALDSVREGITIADPSAPDNPIVYTNNAFLAMTGYSREEVLGRNCRFLQGPDTDPAAVGAIRKALSRREPLTVQLLNYTKAGKRFWNELRLMPVLQPGSGRLLAYVGFQNDVTELLARKQSEARLRDAKEAAESATEAKSQFLANMSHEIRTPLNGMIATTQLLLGSVLTPEQRELAETILESGSTLLGILGDILDFSKIDHGSLELQRRPMCLRQATEACIDLVAAEAAKKGLAVAYLMDDEALARPLLGDPVRIRQVLANLLSNAVKFTERGEVVVRVNVERVEDDRSLQPAAAAAAAAPPAKAAGADAGADAGTAPGSDEPGAAAAAGGEGGDGGEATVIHITVTDTGIGIGEESARKLFQHFRQGSETMSRRYGGTGLGLAISKRLAQLMQGDIWVDSRLGAGSTFHFTLRAEWISTPGPWPWSPPRSAASTPSQSSECTPRTSTDDGPGGGASGSSVSAVTFAGSDGAAGHSQPWAAAVAAGAAGSAAAAALRGGGSWSAAAGGSSRLSGSSTESGSGSRGGRELRTSPWLPDGTPIEAVAAAAAAAAGAGAVGPASISSGASGSGASGFPHSPPQRSSNPGLPSLGSASGCSAGGNGSGVHGTMEVHDERAALLGRTVLIDVSHWATSTQVWNSCRHLGLAAVQAKACSLPSALPHVDSPVAGCSSGPLPLRPAVASSAAAAALAFASAAPVLPATPPSAAAGGATPPPPATPAHDILVVSMDRLVPALKAGWKGRPVVALGDREQLPPALQPLVVVTLLPVRHSRLVTALVKATALLRWNGCSAPKLSNAPIPNESIQNLKSWRLKRGPDADSVNRRTSLDNSALERTAMARGGGASAAGGLGLGLGAGKALGPGGKVSPNRQHMPIPEHAELPPVPDDAHPLPLQPIVMPATPPGAEQSTSLAAAPPAWTPLAGAALAVAGCSAGADALGSGQPQLQHLRILIAEDNKVNQKVVLKVLQQILRGCQPPDVVENGLQVLAALQKKTYDVILMDIHMPEMDGLEASKRIQETYRPEERPRIIALSADTVQTLHDRCREAGIEAFLVKPFRIEELARVMRTGPPRPRKGLEQQEPNARAPPLAA